jgi:hypothetical protein
LPSGDDRNRALAKAVQDDMTQMSDQRATYLAEADRARAVGARTPNPRLKKQWLQIEASYRALADGSITARQLGFVRHDGAGDTAGQ